MKDIYFMDELKRIAKISMLIFTLAVARAENSILPIDAGTPIAKFSRCFTG